MRPLRRVTATLLAVSLAATACSSDDATETDDQAQDSAVEQPSSTPEQADGAAPTAIPAPPSPTPSQTSMPAPSPATSPSPTALPTQPPAPAPTATPSAPPPSACTAPLAGNPTSTSTAAADFDGDLALDQVTVYGLGDNGQGAPSNWRIRVDTAAGESFDSPLDADSSSGAVQPLGGADVDGDGSTEELFTIVGAGASAAIIAVHNRAGCDIIVASAGGAAATFPVGGSIGNIGGLQCIDTDQDGVNDVLLAWDGVADFESADGTYEVEGVEYRLSGTELEQVGMRRLVANIAEADFVYGQLSCGSLSY